MFKKLLILAFFAFAGWYGWQAYQGETAEEDGPSLDELAAQKLKADPNRPSARLIPNTDVPPEGTRSLFDYVIAEHGALPYPFEKLVDLFASYDKDARDPIQVLIPDGRSLLKAEADFKHPRIVAASDAKLPDSDFDYGLYLKSRVFFGLTELADEIEIISYNEEAGRFEFQLVKDYCEGCVPRLVYARRGICLTCHTGGGPIFSVRPWEETNGQPAISNAILKARGIPAEQAAQAEYHGAKIVTKLATPEAYDDLTNIGNVIPTTQQMWIDGCGEDRVKGTECRRYILRLALRYLWNPGGFSTEISDYPDLVRVQKASWPAQGIIQDNGDLQSRDPFTDTAAPSGFLGLIREAVFGGSGQDPTQRQAHRKQDEDAKLEAFEKLPPLRSELDPLTTRTPLAVHGPATLEAVFGVAQMFSPNDKRLLEKHSNYDLQRIENALESSWIAPALEPAPFRRLAVMDGLLKALGVEVMPTSCCRTAEGMSEPMVEGVPPLEITSGSVLEVYEKYCFACHRGNPSARLDFMNGKTEAEVLERIKETVEIADALDYERYLGTRKEGTLMPPSDSHQRELLDQARKEGKDDVQKMVEVIPSMFSF